MEAANEERLGDSDEESDSDDGPKRWEKPSSLEMDCVFLEDEQEEDGLPEQFTLESIEKLKSDNCMLCSETFNLIRLVAKHNCRRCGKMVCENCSR